MADPLSISASFIAIFQLTTTLVDYLNNVKDASSERLRLRDETSSSCFPLYILKERLNETNPGHSQLASIRLLGGPDGPLSQYQRLLEQLLNRLGLERTGDGKRKKIQEIGRALVWPFKKEEIGTLLGAMERFKSLFHLALQNDTVSLSQAIEGDIALLREDVSELRNKFERMWTAEAVSEHRTIVKWLSPLNFLPTQEDIFQRRVEGTGKWFLQSAEFEKWINGRGGTLWCPGIPGAGKTVLMSIVVDHIRNLRSHPVAVIYCNYKEQESQIPVNLVASVWRQLIQDKALSTDQVNQLYRKHIDKDTRPKLKDVSDVLNEELSKYEKVYVLVDALDECADDICRETLCRQLQTFQPRVNLLVTSRHSDSIAQLFSGAPTIEINAHATDVRAYISGRISSGGRLYRHIESDVTLAEDIKESVVETSKNMFLLAQLHMDSLVSKTSRKFVRQALDTLPKSLDATYEEAMSRVNDQTDDDKLLAERVLSWISFAVRPLLLEELREALAVEPDTHKLDRSNLPDTDLLTSICAGLVIVDQKSKIVRLCHFSTEEYLRRVRMTRFPTAQADISEICLIYLLFDEFGKGPLLHEHKAITRVLDCHLLQYAATHWGRHIQGSPEKSLLHLALAFLTSKEHLSSSTQSSHFAEHWFIGESQRYPKNITGLHMAAHFGLEFIAESLLTQGFSITEKDSEGENALHKAAKNGHKAVVQLLLHHGADIMSEDGHGWTALHKAATSGNRALVLLLLEKGATISKGVDGRTALHFAAEFGNDEIATALLGEGADVQAATVPLNGEFFEVKFHAGRTPLHWAAANGHHALVRQLVEHGADVDALNRTLRTPLREAIFLGHTAAAEVLLELGASVHQREKEGWTPLHEAAWRSPVRVTELLIERGAEVEALTNFPQTSIPEPCYEKDEVLKGGNTPLHLAACRGHLKIFNFLHAKGADIQRSDDYGLAPIHMATIMGSKSILEVLLDNGCAVDTTDAANRETALHKAARRDFQDGASLLLNRGADARVKNRHGQDALDIARAESQEEIVALLSAQSPATIV